MRTGSFGHALVKGKRYAEASVFTLLASLPLLTASAERAARRIVRAIENDERFVVIGVPAKIAAPRARALPGHGRARARGREPAPAAAGAGRARERCPLPGELFRRGLARSILTALGDRAARRYNEEPEPA